MAFMRMLPFLLFVSASTLSQALSIVSTEDSLQQANLPTDAPTLLLILERGIDVYRDDEHNRVGIDPSHWHKYSLIVNHLSVVDDATTVPVLTRFVDGDLPLALRRDLLAACVRATHDNSFGSWAEQESIELFQFRAACARALGNLNAQSAVPSIQALLHDIEGELDQWSKALKEPTRYDWIALSHGHAAESLTMLDSRAGIDSLIFWLGRVEPDHRTALVPWLQRCTGQDFGPVYALPVHLHLAEVEKWEAWWMSNSDSDVASMYRDSVQRVSPRPRPSNPTIRDYVAEAVRGLQDYDGVTWGRFAREWLDENGDRYVPEFAAIIEDEDELATVRQAALGWYGRYSGPSGFSLLRTIAIDLSYAQRTIAGQLFQEEALEQIGEHHKDRAAAVAEDCLMLGGRIADRALVLLQRDAKNYEYIAQKFDEIPESARASAIEALARARPSTGKDAFVAAIMSDDLREAAVACTALEDLGLIPGLSELEMSAYDTWISNPEMAFWRARQTGDAVRMLAVVRGLSGTSVSDARLYAQFLLATQPADTSEADGLWVRQQLGACVDAFLETQGVLR